MNIEHLTNLINVLHLPPQVITMFFGALPIVELRGAIPFAHGVLKLGWFAAFFWSFIGSIIPGIIILLVTEPLLNWFSNHNKFCHRIISSVLAKKQKHFHKKYEKYGEIGILLLAATPLPLAGVWSAALIAAVLGYEFWRALILIAVGNVIAGLIVTAFSAGIFSCF
ncbi:MAG: small multi-drug export protein [Gammaproteobacteria bacterium]|nr:small multi-drug export protein [Gammaproteobacteria bacterium]